MPPTDVILWETFEFRSNAFRNITSVGDRQTHFGYRNPRELNRRKAETSRIPLFLCASAQKQGDSIISHWVCAFSHQKRKCPFPFGKIRKEPFPQKGFLAAASFGIFSRQRPRKVHPKRNDIAATISQPHPNKNQPHITENSILPDSGTS